MVLDNDQKNMDWILQIKGGDLMIGYMNKLTTRKILS